MRTTSEILQDELLRGRHLTKFDFLTLTNSVCLAQRVLELRQDGWDVRDKVVKGKGTLREYWLEPDEIKRIKGETKTDEQSAEPKPNIAETNRNEPETHFEQMGLGIPGTESLKERW